VTSDNRLFQIAAVDDECRLRFIFIMGHHLPLCAGCAGRSCDLELLGPPAYQYPKSENDHDDHCNSVLIVNAHMSSISHSPLPNLAPRFNWTLAKGCQFRGLIDLARFATPSIRASAQLNPDHCGFSPAGRGSRR
jgi:hypothetical protein